MLFYCSYLSKMLIFWIIDIIKQLLDSECVTSSVTNEDSSKQTSPANRNIHETKNKPSSTNNGTYFGECEGLKKKDSDLAIKVVDFSCIAYEFEHSCKICVFIPLK